VRRYPNGLRRTIENVEKSVEGVCASTISGKGAMQFSELHHHYPCLGNSLGRTGAISFCGYAAPLARVLNRAGPVIDVDFDLRRMDAAPIKVIDLS